MPGQYPPNYLTDNRHYFSPQPERRLLAVLYADGDGDGPSSGVLDPSWAMHVLVVAALLVTSIMLVNTPDDNDLVKALRLLLLVYVILQQLAANKLFLIKVAVVLSAFCS
jgi:hypothetical protein